MVATSPLRPAGTTPPRPSSPADELLAAVARTWAAGRHAVELNVRYETDADEPAIGWANGGEIDFGTRQAHLRRTWPFDESRAPAELRTDRGNLWTRTAEMPEGHWFTPLSSTDPIVDLVPGLLPEEAVITSSEVVASETADGDLRYAMTLPRGAVDRAHPLWLLYGVKPTRTIRGVWSYSLRVHEGCVVRALLCATHLSRWRRLMVFETVLGPAVGETALGLPVNATVHQGGFWRQMVDVGAVG